MTYQKTTKKRTTRRPRELLRAYLLLVLLGAALGANTCTGKSAKLAPAECDAFGDFYDEASGKTWLNCSETRADPCSCEYGLTTYIQCSFDLTAIEGM